MFGNKEQNVSHILMFSRAILLFRLISTVETTRGVGLNDHCGCSKSFKHIFLMFV